MKSKRAKVLHRAGGLSLAEHAVRAAAAVTDPEWITVVVGHQKDSVEAALQHTGVKFVEQMEQKGTGHAVLMCREALEARGGLVVVTYGDVPLLSSRTLRRLIAEQETQAASRGAGATMLAFRIADPSGYGRVLLDSRGMVEAIVEHKAANAEQLRIDLVNSGIYCFRADLLWKLILEIRPDNPAREYYLTDLAGLLARSGHPMAVLEAEDPRELLGINTRLELAEVDRVFRERKARELMLDGVTIEKPETVSIDSQVEIGIDTVVEPFARITGNTVIGEDCHIGASSIIEDSRLENGAVIAPLTHIAQSHIAAKAHIGPFARLRMQTRVEAGAHIGNFVELKNTHLGAGSKANHLAYLGDSDIGAAANIGAGTITCNYDGRRKHRTMIGDGTFIGSNSTLVAPVEVGAESYVAAGSVITQPVPSGALGIGRGRQENKPGWVAKRKLAKQPV